MTPERRLLLAMIRQAALDLDSSDPQVQSDAESWVANTEGFDPTDDAAITFIQACSEVGFRPRETRKVLLHRESRQAFLRKLAQFSNAIGQTTHGKQAGMSARREAAA
jgi:hypothetical protein